MCGPLDSTSCQSILINETEKKIVITFYKFFRCLQSSGFNCNTYTNICELMKVSIELKTRKQ